MPSHPDRVRRNYSSSDGQRVPFYRGHRATELTRAELLVAYGRILEVLERDQQWQRERAKTDRMFDEAMKHMS